MTVARYIASSLAHYRFAYLGVLAGAVLGATVLFGSLFAGDSVARSLREISAQRTGRATHLLTAGDRFFREALAAELAAQANVRTAPLLMARGTAVHPTNRTAANQVQIVGVTDAFWQLAPEPGSVAAPAINATLARRLGAAVGDPLILRLQKPGILSGNAPIAGADTGVQSVRLTLAAIVDDASFGRFGLEATQAAPATVFLPIATLQEALGQPARANLMLVGPPPVAGPLGRARDDPPTGAPTKPELERALATTVQLADHGLALRWLEKAGVFELVSKRIFIDPALTAAIGGAVPEAQPVVSYLVNEFRAGENATPYSIATATTRAAAPFLPANLARNDIVLNAWLAEDLRAQVGDEVRVKFFQAGAGGALVEQAAAFRVKAIVPLAELAADTAWMPDFPGISDAKRQGDWNSGLPLDMDRIREKDEAYWDDYRGAPKAFLSLAAARELWSTRWGDITALRIPFARGREVELATTIRRALRPEMSQLLLRDFRASAEAAAKSSVDFGGLFLGMSFFLILAALGLVAMLFQFCLLQRNREDALLGAVGVSPRKLLRWRLAEGAAILVVAVAAGLPLAALYTRGILRFLERIWADQAAGATFVFATQPASIALGAATFLLLSLFAIWLAIRQLTRRALSIRLAANAQEITRPGVRRSSLILAATALAIAAGAVAVSGRALPAQGAFYLAGFALLFAGLAVCRFSLASPADANPAARIDASYLGRLNLKARRSRSLTVVGLIATAVFMVLSVASFRKHVGADWLERGSGTGGFTFWIETTAPLNPARDGRTGGFEILEPHASVLGEIVALRTGAGDNVNCFNLNSTQQPKLLAVDAARLAARGAFRLKAATWDSLRAPRAGALPALVDETTLLWALKRKIGDFLTYTDENGQPFTVQIVGTLADSVFQGHVLVDEALFLKKFPSSAGYSVFLLDARGAPPAELAALRTKLETSARDVGGRVEFTRDVLAAFHQVENTYIAIFNVLGSLGVVLGSLGLAIVVARNLRERRGELAVLTAIGIPAPVLARMVFAEHSRLVVWGIAIGGVSAAIAVWPSASTLPAAPALALVATLLVGIVALNLVSGWLVFRRQLSRLRPGTALAEA